MKNHIIFIDNPISGVSEDYTPLGILTIAASLPPEYTFELFDLPNSKNEIKTLLDSCKSASLIAMSSICSTYPRTIGIANKIKEVVVNVPIVLGGPQASSTAKITLENYKSIDYILSGEADLSFRNFLSFIEGTTSAANVAGLCYRENCNIKLNKNEIIEDLSVLPLPLYELAFRGDVPDHIPMEIGRGCPFNCEFCSTSSFFSNYYRTKSVQKVIKDMLTIISKFNPRQIDFIHDMMLVNKKWVLELCKEIKANDINVKWTCSARTDFVSYNLLSEMKSAGFDGIFFGIETGSQKMQTEINKNLKIPEVNEAIENCEKLDIRYTASFIGGFPTENKEDLQETLNLLFKFGSSHFKKNSIQFHLLTPPLPVLQ